MSKTQPLHLDPFCLDSPIWAELATGMRGGRLCRDVQLSFPMNGCAELTVHLLVDRPLAQMLVDCMQAQLAAHDGDLALAKLGGATAKPETPDATRS